MSGSLTITSEKLSMVRAFSDLPIEILTVADVRPALSSTSRACPGRSARCGRQRAHLDFDASP
jgi:hypothetical protein